MKSTLNSTVFGMREIKEREVGEREREIEEKEQSSLVWFEEKCEREKFRIWDPHVFCFSPHERRRAEKGVFFSNFHICPGHLHYFKLLKIAENLKTTSP